MKQLSAPDIESLIRTIRDQRVILDSDLAALYGVQTKRLNEQVKRNAARFPADFAFSLTESEKAEVVANCDHLESCAFHQFCLVLSPNTGPSWRPTFSTALALWP